MASQEELFIAKLAPIAIEQAKKHGNKLYPSVTIAQAALESGWGTSKKMINANALYGVKVGKSAYKFGTAWKGEAYKTGTVEYYDGKNPTRIKDFFRKYSNISDATEDYMDMLCHCQRYANSLSRKTPEESIRAIAAGGYATGPDYANHVIAIIRDKKYNLTQYDMDAPAQMPPTGNPYPEPTKIVKANSRGNDARWLQVELNRYGYKLIVDGIIGPKSLAALTDFQVNHNLVPDSLCGPLTRAMLKEGGK